MRRQPVSALDFPSLVGGGDRILIGQGTAEPLTLTRRLMQQAHALPPCRVFVGPLYSDTFRPDAPAHISFESYGAIGRAAELAKAGRLALYPEHFSSLSALMGTSTMPADVVLLQLRPASRGDGYNLGLARDFVIEAARRARHVVAELNPYLPECHGGEVGADELRLAALVEAAHPPVELLRPVANETERAIAARVAALVPDRAALQVGIGSVIAAVLDGLADHRDLGFHSGAAPEGLADLAEAGVVTNAYKEIDKGVSVGGILLGSQRLYDFAHRNPAFRLAGPSQTHNLAHVAALSRFHAINSAIEVDLTGQIGAELAGGRYVGAVGGQVDFIRAAGRSAEGRAIIALPSVTSRGESRIVTRVSTVTCSRADADTIVTEHGVAELRGQAMDDRARRMIAIAAPQWRETLERQWRESMREQ